MSGTFDANSFLGSSITGSSETKYTPIPKGEYSTFIDDLGVEKLEAKDGKDEATILVITHAIMDEDLKKSLGLEKPTIQDRIFLDLENGALAFGPNKNVRLGRVREAAGQNDPKKSWNMNMLRGAGPFKILVDHRPGKNDGEVYSQIARIAKG